MNKAIEKPAALTAATLDAVCFIGKPVEKEIKWHNGDSDNVATVYVKPLSYDEAVEQIESYNGEQKNKDAIAQRIASSIVDEAGNPVFTVADIIGTADKERGAICSGLTMALLSAIGEVNGLGKG